MIKKMAGAAVGTLLIASMLTGSFCIAGAVTNKTATPALTAPETIAAPAPAAEPGADDYTAYLFLHFVGESDADDEQIYFSVSQDGTSWTTLNGKHPILRSDVGEKGVRDPHIIRGQDGKFYIVATDLSIHLRGGWSTGVSPQTTGSQSIIVWEGNGLTDWSEARMVDVGSSYHALDVWAPEVIWDNVQNKYMVFWASIVGNRTTQATDWVYRIYRSYTTDFETFTPAEVYMERKDSTIDTTFYYDEENDTYYRFSKTEGGSANWVYMEKGDSIDGAFEMVSTFTVDGKPYTQMSGYEGPTLYKLNDQDKICLLLDHYGTSAGYAPYVTENIEEGVFTPGTAFNFNGVTFRHGSVIPIKQSEYDALMETYGDTDKTTGDKIYELEFTGDTLTATTGSQYQVETHGTITYEEGATTGRRAAVISGDNNYISLDGSMLVGHRNLTVSFVAKMAAWNGKNAWVYFAAPNEDEQVYGYERYIAGLWNKDNGNLECERYYGINQGRPETGAYGQMGSDWAYVTVVYSRTKTIIYVNGAQVGEVNATFSIADILGKTPILQLGKANWPNGEYSNMRLDRFRIYDYAMPAQEVAELYAADSATA